MRNLLASLRPLPAYHIRLFWPRPGPDGADWWLSRFEELPGCMVQGQSMSEAEAKLWRILPGYLRELRRHGQAVPQPLETPSPSIEGLSVVMVPAGVQARPTDPGITAPNVASPRDMQSASARADASLLGT